MKRILIVLMALSVCPLFAAEKPWPQKGDTIYISARLRWTVTVLLPGGPLHRDGTIEPCVPVTINRRVSEDRIYFRDEIGEGGRLEGDWRARLHRTTDECGSYLKVNGLPHVEADAASFRLVEQPAH